MSKKLLPKTLAKEIELKKKLCIRENGSMDVLEIVNKSSTKESKLNKNRKYPYQKLIHHSDRGFQYYNPKYTTFAEENNIAISMTKQYDPYENAVAERINRTLKYEYELKQTIKNKDLAQKMAEQAVYIYNNLRTHFSLGLRKPAEVHLNPNIKYKSYR